MIFALSSFSSVFPAFNRRPLTESDFYAMCELEQITVAFDDLPTLKGFYARLNNRKYIFLDRRLRGLELLVIAFHELAHVVLHEPRPPVTGIAFYSHSPVNKEEAEAIAVALVCIYPTSLFDKLMLEAPSEDPFERDLHRQRLRLRQTCI